jgi:hypothetical protein
MMENGTWLVEFTDKFPDKFVITTNHIRVNCPEEVVTSSLMSPPSQSQKP